MQNFKCFLIFRTQIQEVTTAHTQAKMSLFTNITACFVFLVVSVVKGNLVMSIPELMVTFVRPMKLFAIRNITRVLCKFWPGIK